MPVILAMWEAEIRRIMVRSQPTQIVGETLSQKNPSQNRAGGRAQCVGLKFKPQYCQNQPTKQTKRNLKRLGSAVCGKPITCKVEGPVESSLRDFKWIKFSSSSWPVSKNIM
jgi:hypothetical protein